MRRRDKPEITSSDLFSARTLPAKIGAHDLAAPPAPAKILLPTDLERSLAVLDDSEFARLLAGVNLEAARRNRRLQPVAKPKAQAAVAEAPRSKTDAAQGVTSAKASLVRAAIRAGVKPTAIARQFGLSKAAINAVLKLDRTYAGLPCIRAAGWWKGSSPGSYAYAGGRLVREV